MWKIVFISFALVQAIQCRTNQDVLNDFEPVIRERHEEITALKNLTERTMNPIFNHFDEELRKQAENISGYLLPESFERIATNITEYIKQIGLENHPELTKPCLDSAETSVNRMLFMVNGGGRSCYMLTMDYFTPIYSQYTNLTKRIENDHLVLDGAQQKDCVKLSTPFEVQSCLINFLYTYFNAHLEDVSEEINYSTKGWTLELNITQNKITDPCFKILRNDITIYEEQTIADTKICLWAIPKPSSQ